MRELVVIAVMCGVARADVPRVKLVTQRTVLLGGHLTVRLVEGMALADGSNPEVATLDWGAVRFTLVAESADKIRSMGVREQIVADRELGCARVERLAASRAGTTYGAAPVVPHETEDRALVYVAYGATVNGYVAVLRFYVGGETDDPQVWAPTARAIALSLDLRDEPSPALPRRNDDSPVSLPSGWQWVREGARELLSSRDGSCEIVDRELDPHVIAPADALHVLGRMKGDDMYWSVWADRDGAHAEAIVGASKWGFAHATCHAKIRRELAEQRAIVEQLLRWARLLYSRMHRLSSQWHRRLDNAREPATFRDATADRWRSRMMVAKWMSFYRRSCGAHGPSPPGSRRSLCRGCFWRPFLLFAADRRAIDRGASDSGITVAVHR